jgi:hypothetical protein
MGLFGRRKTDAQGAESVEPAATTAKDDRWYVPIGGDADRATVYRAVTATSAAA